ncbi:tyrosine-type recombinase/integrase [Muricauda sp. TY007]|uniref:site-specific integrase n=1 Tax=Allomuricauda sp. TY007 TaxID=2683200 RepID=UPI0013BF7F63|nr:site-specific integrase [Muricauda sp. TY007]NDV17692.1 tyrosine-type recombinase/integrase [Muricauda sp. TY007]
METKTFSSIFYLRNSRLDKNGKAGIYFRITVNGQRAELSIKRKTSPEKWCSAKGRIKGSSKEAKEMNHYMDQLETKAYEIYSKLMVKKKPYNAETIKNKLLGKGTEHKTLLAIYGEHNAQIKELIGSDYSYGAYRRHVRTMNHLARFIQKEYKVSDLYVMEVDLNFVNRFHHYLKTQKIGNQNTVTKYVVNFKKIMRMAFANNWVKKDPFYSWKAEWKKVERNVLTEAELRSLIDLQLESKSLEQVRDIFVFCCFTGLAYVDVKKLSNSHIVNGIEGKRWIKIKRAKTDSLSSVPLLPIAEKILRKYEDHSQKLITAALLPVISNQKTNAYLKEIASACEIKKKLTFHLARHTFATTVTLANGISIESVSKMLGHQSLKTTQIYAKVIDKKLYDDMSILQGKY